jgi:DNA topoisomerase VI subunit B
MTASLARKVFVTSRLSEFCSEKELTTQTGHSPAQWPLVILKELVDNSLDEAEKAGVAPVIDIEVTAGGEIIVADKSGAGIAADTVSKLLDYTVRASDKEAYASPTRGAQGNALKTILAMPFVLHGSSGETLIEAQGTLHKISFEIDQVRREPRIRHEQLPSLVRIGTRITIRWPETPRSQLADVKWQFLQIAENLVFFNPHLALRVKWDAIAAIDVAPACPDWCKWLPSDPTSPHWYDDGRFERHVAAHVANDQDTGNTTLVREFVGTLRGLSGSGKQKQLLEEIGASRQSLAEFFSDGKNRQGVTKLLAAMKALSSPVKPTDLGVLGRDHLADCFEWLGASMETFTYTKDSGTTIGGLPWVVEVAFAWNEELDGRRLITGLNFSAAINNPFRHLGLGAWSLDELLSDRWADWSEPVIVFVHLTCPVLAYSDRGKGTVLLGQNDAGGLDQAEIGSAIIRSVEKVTAAWMKLRRAEDRHAINRAKRAEKLARSRDVSVKDAAYSVMEEAYLKASSGGTLPANARQIMYAARGKIQDATGKQLDDKYFTQTLLPDYVAEHGVDWDVVYDDRGHFIEPHGGQKFGLGTLNVRRYLAGLRAPRIEEGHFSDAAISTHGPQGNYGGVLFIEKEGFLPLLDRINLPNRFDLALMSTKGASVTAARQLAERICSERGIPLYILHDFDKAGFSIKSTLHEDTRRYQFKETVQVVDLGLRLQDVIDLNLEGSAERAFDKGAPEARAENMRTNGATEEEITFLLERRVELNAMTSEQFVQFVERKLTEHGVTKVIPDPDTMSKTYLSMVRSVKIQQIIERAIKEMGDGEAVSVPEDLADQVADLLDENPSWRWDEAVAAIADENTPDAAE